MDPLHRFHTPSWWQTEDEISWAATTGCEDWPDHVGGIPDAAMNPTANSSAINGFADGTSPPTDHPWAWPMPSTAMPWHQLGAAHPVMIPPVYPSGPALAALGTADGYREHHASNSFSSGVPSPSTQWSMLSDGSYQHPFSDICPSDDHGARPCHSPRGTPDATHWSGVSWPMDDTAAQPPPLPVCAAHASTITATTAATNHDSPMPSTPLWTDLFSSTRGPLLDPPPGPADTAPPQRKAKRFADDLYTPAWVRHHGPQREGWCGWCAAWFTLRDSTYWYHMHYAHGISQAHGRRLPAPAGFRAPAAAAMCDSTATATAPFAADWEAECARCGRWMALSGGGGDRGASTAYFRHTYKCYFKSRVKGEQKAAKTTATAAGSSPRKAGAARWVLV